jgi:hypothetical protein
MIGLRRTRLESQDQAAYRAVIAFLEGRLRERATIDWALQLRTWQTVQRVAVLDLIEQTNPKDLGEPWLSAWSLIQATWEATPPVDAAVAAYGVRRRLSSDDRTGLVIAQTIELVKPRLEVRSLSKSDLQLRPRPSRPKTVSDLLTASLTSGEVFDPAVLELSTINEHAFMSALASGLESAVMTGLDLARRLGWESKPHLWRVGQLNRVYYVPVNARPAGGSEPDEFHRGIAPSVKLLHAVLMRLADVALSDAVAYVRRWKLVNSPVHLRLWAALSRDPRITPAEEVGEWLLGLDDRPFWNLINFPEIAELRARRFTELSNPQQRAIAARLRKGPPRNQWPKKTDATRVRRARQYWTVRELRRLVVGGATLSENDQAWLIDKVGAFPDLAQMAGINAGFLDAPQAHYVQARPENRFDPMAGDERLKALEEALSSARSGWDDDPARGAADWIRHEGNASRLIADFESAPDHGADTPRVWEQFGWTHSPAANQGEAPLSAQSLAEATRVLTLLGHLPGTAAVVAIEGISHWMQRWEQHISALPSTYAVWSNLWPIAVAATNSAQQPEETVDLNTVAPSADDREPNDLDTLNTPVGRLVGVFLAACPQIQEGDRPFGHEGNLRSMRDTIISSPMRSGLIVRCRLIEHLPYFLMADPEWARELLITPLLSDTVESLALWRAVARQTQFTGVLTSIGAPMSERAVDRRLGRETRQSLVFSLVVECLHALREARTPAVPYSRIQQMLRSLDDEVRAYAAGTLRRFIEGVSSRREGGATPPRREALFEGSAAPFLKQVWPQERSLNTPATSKAFAHLPAACGEDFAAAVDAVERFLVPFECWSLIEYGLYGDEDGRAKLARINDPGKAAALLRLLDRTVGVTEASVIPHDLSDALLQIRRADAKLEGSATFHRLATAARR